MATECQLIQEALAEHRGEVGRLDDVSRRHLDSCPECCEVAAAERALDPRAVAAAAVLGLLGFGGVVAVALRWRKISPWRKSD